MADAATTEMRVDDLARAAGVATTTIRLYQSKGLLPPPRLVGRTGYYDDSHLDRLRAIARLQDDGFSLAGIGALIDRWQRGGDLDDLLGADGHLDRFLGAREPLVLTAEELLARFPVSSLDPASIQRAAQLGLIEMRDDGRFVVSDPRSLETGAALARMGVPLDVVLDEWEALQATTDRVAERFADVFQQHLLPTDGLDDLDASTAQQLATTLTELRANGTQILVAAFEASLRRVASARFAELFDDDPDAAS
ncbi:MAG: MerR family transcriptional regulator [Actinomycetota bacterium]|nr:MerR family transcriptional regulator [Actinomycetota bacterium]